MGGIDDFLKQVEEDELEDAIAERVVARINDYARSRGVKPQLVHYYVRGERLKKSQCVCGTWVINIDEADQVMGLQKPNGDNMTDIERRHSDQTSEDEVDA